PGPVGGLDAVGRRRSLAGAGDPGGRAGLFLAEPKARPCAGTPMPDLAQELLVVLAMMTATVALHLLGLTGLTRLTRVHIERWRTPWLSLDRLLAPLLMVVGLFG